MFDLVRNNKKIVQIFLLLICLPFVFFGVESYVNHNQKVASVAQIKDFEISLQMLEQAIREKQNQLRNQLKENYDSSKTNTKQFKLEVLNNLINEQVLLLEAQRLKIFVGDEQVRQIINEFNIFYDDNGKFSNEKYKQILSAQGLTPARFENDLRKTLLQQQLLGTIIQTSFKSKTLSQNYFFDYSDEYAGSILEFPLENYKSKVVLNNDLIKKYYEEHKNDFVTPERIKVDYLVFSDKIISDNLADSEIKDEEISNYYKSNVKKFTTPEERRLSHIVFDKKDKAKAEQILKELVQNTDNFAKVAKENSIDTISAKNGGDIGFIKQDFSDKAIAEAVFKIKAKNDIFPQLVESDFGFHILQLTEIKDKIQQPLEEVKEEIITTLKTQKAQKLFAEQSENFSNSVYDQADSLEPTAKQFNLTIQHSDWISKSDFITNNNNYIFINPKLVDTLFDKNFINEKRNSEAVDVGNNTLVSVRISAYEDKKQKSLSSIENEIKVILTQQEASKLAKIEIDNLLKDKALLTKTFADSNNNQIKHFDLSKMSLIQNEKSDLDSEIINTIFSFPKNKTTQLPLYKSVAVDDKSYFLIQLKSISNKNNANSNSNEINDAIYTSMFNTINENYVGVYIQQWLIALRKKYNVQINEKVLEDNKE